MLYQLSYARVFADAIYVRAHPTHGTRRAPLFAAKHFGSTPGTLDTLDAVWG